MRILGIESSCDETSVAVFDTEQGLLSHQIHSQIPLHQDYGGVVPELAARDHIQRLRPLIQLALEQSQLDIQAIEGIAYTAGPGLVGALLSGATFAKSLAFALEVPSIGVHHLEAHVLAVMLEKEKPDFPFLALLVSGGHTMLVLAEALGHYKILGQTLDDAVGECFDKVGKLMGLPYPGGVHVARWADTIKTSVYQLPRPMLDRAGYNFSFSGLKTSARLLWQRIPATDQNRAELAKALQESICETLVEKTRRAVQATGLHALVLAGGVAANQCLRQQMAAMMTEQGGVLYVPRSSFCTDNAAMVAYTGSQYLKRGKIESLAILVKPRWPLDQRA